MVAKAKIEKTCWRQKNRHKDVSGEAGTHRGRHSSEKQELQSGSIRMHGRRHQPKSTFIHKTYFHSTTCVVKDQLWSLRTQGWMHIFLPVYTTHWDHLIIFSQPSASPPTPSWLKYGTILLLLLYNIFAKQYFYSNNFLLMRVLEEYLGESSSTAIWKHHH